MVRLRRFLGRLSAIGLVATLFLAGVGVTAIAPQRISAYDPALVQPEIVLEPPSVAHVFGTDQYGRDVFTRVVFGARTSLRFALIATSISLSLSTTFGTLAAFYRGRVDSILMRLVDLLMAFPGILLALIVVALLGPGLAQATFAAGFGQAPSFVRVVRGSAFAARTNLYVEAAEAAGASGRRIIWRHILPNIAHTVLVLGTLGFGEAILIGASLSFLGLGAQPPTPEWGGMLGEARGYLASNWWTAVLPGAALGGTLLCLNIVGDQLRDILDPRLR